MILEQLDPRGRVVHRLPLEAAPITVGRAYDNDLVLDDPYVEAHHLRIEPNGDGMQFSDLGSTNGTWDQARHRRMDSGLVRAGLELRVGRTVLRFGDPELPVPAAIVDPGANPGIARHLLDPRVAASLVLIAVVAAGIDGYLASSEDFTLVDFLTPGLAGLLGATVWAGGWAFANRLVSHRFRFLPHLGWASLIGVAGLVVQAGTQWLRFFVPGARTGWAGLAADLVLGASLIAGHLWLATEWDARRRWRAAVLATGAAAVVIGLLASDLLIDAEGGLDGGQVLKPVSASLVPAGSADDFFRQARSLEGEVDGLVEEGLP